MRLIKYDNRYTNPFAELDRWLSQALGGTERLGVDRWADLEGSGNLRVNVYQDKDALYLTAELPGVSKKDLTVELENAVLTIRGERQVTNGKDGQVFRFERSITVGDDVNAEKVKAKLEDGILLVTLPKAEHRKPKAITVA